MVAYTPTRIAGYETGYVESRQDFLLPGDAFPNLVNAYVFREKIKRKLGTKLVGRLRRSFDMLSLGVSGASPWSFNLWSTLVPPITPEATAELAAGSIVIAMGAVTLSDNGDGTLSSVTPGYSGTINYITGAIVITHPAPGVATTIDFAYFPGLPVMGLRTRERTFTNNEQTLAFDTKYCYRRAGSVWTEFITGTEWSGTDSDFFWSTNYWTDSNQEKLFWTTNFSGPTGDPMRYTNGTAWEDFAPQVDAAGNYLEQALILLPFRSRLLAINTWEGATLAGSLPYQNRIRWAAIGNPITVAGAIPITPSADAWRSDIRGKGGYLDLPTSEAILAAGFVRDNLVIYCERSTWQLRYTGQSIAPFQIEKVNTELGTESTFGAVSFDTSLMGIGDKGIVNCDSFKSERVDIKIPNFVFGINNLEDGTKRVHGIRQFIEKMAYWTYPTAAPASKFPNRRLAFNYENESWSIHTDSFTCFGQFQPSTGTTWAEAHRTWASAHVQWKSQTALRPVVVAGNQQGFVSEIDSQVTNDDSLYIYAITVAAMPTTRITSYNHNLEDGMVISIHNIPDGNDYDVLNDGVYGVQVIDADNFYIYLYSDTTKQFDDPILVEGSPVYLGAGTIAVRDNFLILSKKFDHSEEGQAIQVGYMDILTSNTSSGEITLSLYKDYVDALPANDGVLPFFNTKFSTANGNFNPAFNNKSWHRVYCACRGQFIQYEFTLSNEQMNGISQESMVEIDAQVLWERPAGRLI